MPTVFATALTTVKNPFDAGQQLANHAIQKLEGKKPSIGFLFCSADYDYPKLYEGLFSIIGDVLIVGCSAAGMFTEESVEDEGASLALVASDDYLFQASVGEHLKKDYVQAVMQAVKKLPNKVEGYSHLSTIILVDGLANKGEETALISRNLMDQNITFAGGLASDNFQFLRTPLFFNGRQIEDGLLLCFIASKQPPITTVRNGHVPRGSSMVITKAKDNIVYEIDQRPAFSVWREKMKELAHEYGLDIKTKLSRDDITDLLLRFQAGLHTYDKYKVRYPQQVIQDDAMVFACSLYEGAVIHMMASDEEQQIETAREAALHAVELATAKGRRIVGALVFDCTCRKSILKTRFPEAIQALRDVLKVPFIGFETYGEISMSAGQMSGLHNTTIVLYLFLE